MKLTTKTLRLMSFLLAVLSLAVAAGCAMQTVVIGLGPPTPVSQISLTRNPQAATGGAITLARPKGPGANSVIGSNPVPGSGVLRFAVRDDPSVWIANALAAGLDQAGYRVERAETTEAAQTPTAISIDVIEVAGLIVDSGDARARLVARVKVYQDRRLTLKRSYSGIYSGPQEFVSVVNSVEVALDHAMTNFLNQALPDLTAFLAHTPHR